MSIFIKEIFYTLQGEGDLAGKPALFVRSGQCNLDCSFCDTNWKDDLVAMDDEEIVDAMFRVWFENMNPDEFIRRSPVVVLTGGEPSLWDYSGVLECLHQAAQKKGWHSPIVTIESNGSGWWPWMSRCMLTISPKTHIRMLSQIALDSASSLKFLFGKRFPKYYEDPELDEPRNHGKWTMYLQPIWGDMYEDNLEGAVQYCLAHPRFRISLQLHKYLNLP